MIRVCPSCGAKNRVPLDKVTHGPKCGSCKGALPAIDAPIVVENAADFDALVGGAKVPVLVDFWAPWCGPCRTVAPEVEKLAREKRSAAVVAKVNTDAVPDVARRFAIHSIPTLILFRQGREAKRVAGAMDAGRIARSVGL